MGGSGNVLRYGSDYFKIWSWEIFFNIFGLAANGLIRTEGGIKQAMKYTMVSVALNAILAPVLIHVVGWGIKGAALASKIAMASYTFLTVRYFLIGKASFKQGKSG